MLQSLAKAKYFKKVSKNGVMHLSLFDVKTHSYYERLKKKLQKTKWLEPWKRVVKARRMNEGYLIKWFQ
ncbi:hypothetical protein Bca4012_073048 [Brassica carinata]